MPPEKTHILLQDFFYMPVMAMKATNESFYQEQKIWVLAPEAFSAQVGKWEKKWHFFLFKDICGKEDTN